MKKVQKVTRLSLGNDHFHDFILFGLVSSEPDYKLSLEINKKFKIALKNISPVRIQGNDEIFSRFSYTDEAVNHVYNLVSNRSDKAYLLSKIKNIDYLLQIIVSENDHDIKKIAAGLRELDSVTAVFIIDIKTLRDKNLEYLNQ